MDPDYFFDCDWLPSLDLSSDQWASLNIDLGLDPSVDFDLPLPVHQDLRISSPIAPLESLAPSLAVDPSPSQPYGATELAQPLPERFELSSSVKFSRTSIDPCTAEASSEDRTAEASSEDHTICPLPAVTKDTQGYIGDNIASSRLTPTVGMFFTFPLDNRLVKSSTKPRISEGRRKEIAEMRKIGSCVLCRRDKRPVCIFVLLEIDVGEIFSNDASSVR